MISNKKLIQLIGRDSYRPLWQMVKIFSLILVIATVIVFHSQWDKGGNSILDAWLITTCSLLFLSTFLYIVMAIKQVVTSWQASQFVLLPVSRFRLFTVNLFVRWLVFFSNLLLISAIILSIGYAGRHDGKSIQIFVEMTNLSLIWSQLGYNFVMFTDSSIGLFLFINFVGYAVALGVRQLLGTSSKLVQSLTFIIVLLGVVIVLASPQLSYGGDSLLITILIDFIGDMVIIALTYLLFTKWNTAN